VGNACTTDGDCAGGSCGKLAQAFREGSIKECAGLDDAFPATGQNTCWDGAGLVIACAGTGHDGEFQAGAALAYVDNGDGTITDLNTGLMWEKLSDDGSIHDKDATYTWEDAFASKVAALNAGLGFAGYTDWRAPNLKELVSIINYETSSPAISSAFNDACTPGRTIATCSCTQVGNYWPSTTRAQSPNRAWGVNLLDGGVTLFFKTDLLHVRAVRGGL
jgi:hypothetical protein